MSNRLAKEDSPYLQQHADNPVDWYPWGEEAFLKARKEHKPIFLSIGYSSCHWCHVMEKESFENKEIAEILNRRFVSIKVDREERPDIDKHFQEVYQLLNRRPGGWPTSIFLTEEGKPFYAATYIPPEPRYGMVGFKELLTTIALKYAKEKEQLTQKAEEILGFLNKQERVIQATKLDRSIASRYMAQATQLYDQHFGGFGQAPKFPQVSTYETLLDLYQLTGDKEALNKVLFSLSQMAKGGLYDLVDGGFCRYSTDTQWLVPHFEKMTYDNALLSQLYLRAYRLSGNDFYKKIAFETIEFMRSKMSKNGLFYAASDADSDGVEGGYFLYDYRETLEALIAHGIERKEAESVLALLHITPQGNVEGKSIVRIDDHALLDKEPLLATALSVLRRLRQERRYPFIDKKIILSWNAMMISTLFKAAVFEPRYLAQAQSSLETLLETLRLHGQLFHSTLLGRKPKVHAFLEDYAYLAEALIDAYQATLDERYLLEAQKIVNQAIERFYVGGKWKFSRGEFETDAEKYDNSYPSSVATILWAIESIASLVDSVYRKFLFKSLEVLSYELMRQPISMPKLTRVTLRFLYDDIVLKAKPDALKEVIAHKVRLSYPYLWLRTELIEGFMLCNSSACFGHEKDLQGALERLETYTQNALRF